MLRLLPFLLLVLAGHVLEASKRKLDEYTKSVEGGEGEKNTELELSCKQARTELHFPSELLLMRVFSMLLNEEAHKRLIEDSKRFKPEHPLYMSQFLAHRTDCDALRHLPFDDELFKLLRNPDIELNQLPLKLADGSLMWPGSKPMIEFVNEKVLQNTLMSLPYKHKYFSDLVDHLIKHKEIELLDHLIMVIDDSLLDEPLPSSFDVRELISGQSAISMKSAFKLCRLCRWQRNCLLVAIFLRPMKGELLNEALTMLKGFLLVPKFGAKLVTHMIESINCRFTEPFPHLKELTELVYRNNMILLNLIEEEASSTDVRRCISYARVLYSIKLGFIQTNVIVTSMNDDTTTEADNEMAVDAEFEETESFTKKFNADLNDKLITDIAALGLLPNMGQNATHAKEQLSDLMLTVFCTKNQDLFAKLVHCIKGTSYMTQSTNFSCEYVTELISSMRWSLSNLDCLVPLMKLCKDLTGSYPDGEWINRIDPSYRLAIFAEMKALDRFEAALEVIKEEEVLKRAWKVIIRDVRNPSPFVERIQALTTEAVRA